MVEIIRRNITTYTDRDVTIMRRCIDESEKSLCVRTNWGCAIVDEKENKRVMGRNTPPINGFGLCGGDICVRDGPVRSRKQQIEAGKKLALSCVHAEEVAMYKFLQKGFNPADATVYLYGSGGASLPCASCMRMFIHLGIKRFFISGYGDTVYTPEPAIPTEWLAKIEYGVIPFRVLSL